MHVLAFMSLKFAFRGLPIIACKVLLLNLLSRGHLAQLARLKTHDQSDTQLYENIKKKERGTRLSLENLCLTKTGFS